MILAIDRGYWQLKENTGNWERILAIERRGTRILATERGYWQLRQDTGN
jgi:hypothetical protein